MSDTSTTTQKLAAEFVGTFLLVLFGCGSVVMSSVLDVDVQYLAIALAFGLAYVVGIYSFGRVSGAHFNPAVSVGAAISGRMSWSQVPGYAGAQVLGGIVAAALLRVIVAGLPDGAVRDDFLGQNFFGNGGFSWWGALIVEIVLTAVLVTVILAVTDARNEHPSIAPLAIGLSLVVIHLFAIPLTGTSVNPARSIGPALFSGTESLKDLWLFIVAPVIGAAVAGLSYPAVFGHGSDPVPGSGLALGRPGAGAATPGYGAPDQFQQEWNQQDWATQQQPYESEPIIQDGWQWDHAAQEWKPLEHWTSPGDAQAVAAAPVETQPTDATAVAMPAVEPAAEPTVAPTDTPEPDVEHTQIRPPQDS